MLFALPTQGPGVGVTPLQEANGDVPLNRVTRMGSQIFGYLGLAGIQNGKILG